MFDTPRMPDDFYIVGGTIVPGSASYVKRDADTKLYDQIQRRELSYVLTSRQMGKSSLIAATAERLQSVGVRTATADLTLIGGNQATTSATQWYYGIVRVIVRQLKLKIDLQAWWQERQSMTALKRMMEFFRELVKVHCPDDDVVVFIDEIETTIELPYSDDLFAVIRACHNAKAGDPDLQRLTFVLIGVATPGELINNPKRTPFNIGQRVDLTDFTEEEAKQLVTELGGAPNEQADVLSQIIFWTGGHPYLTQKLCSKLADYDNRSLTLDDVDRSVDELFTSPGASNQEDNLQTVRDRLTRKGAGRRHVLKMYARIHSGRSQAHSPLSPTQTKLKLSGIVRVDDKSMLKVRNRIYEQVFTADWARAEMPVDWLKRSALAAISILLLSAVYWYQILYPQPFIAVLEESLIDKSVAEQAYVALKKIPFYDQKADQLWAEFWTRRGEYAIEVLDHEIANEAHRKMTLIPDRGSAADELYARFWDARALNASSQEDREAVLILTLKALCIHDTVDRRKRITQLIGEDYQSLDQTLRSSRTARACYGKGVSVVDFSPDRRYALTHTPIQSPLVVDVATGDVVECYQGSPIGFSPESNVLVQDSKVNQLHLFSPNNMSVALRSMVHGGVVDQHLFSEESNVLLTRFKHDQASGSAAQLWNYVDATPIGEVLKLKSGIESIALSRDGSLAVCGDSSGNFGIWDAQTGKLVHSEPDDTKPDGTGTTSPGKSDEEENGTKGESIGKFAKITAIAITSRGTRIAIARKNGSVCLLDRNGKCQFRSRDSAARIRWIGIDPSDHVLLVASNTAVEFRDINDGTLIGSVQVDPSNSLSTISNELVFSRTGRFVAIPNSVGGKGEKSALRIWSTRDARSLPAPVLVRDDVRCLAFSPNEQFVAIGSYDGTAQEYRVSDGRPVGRPLVHPECIIDIAYMESDNEVRLATGTHCGLSRLWSLDRTETTTDQRTISVHGGIDGAVLSGDGSVVGTIDHAGKPEFQHSDGRPIDLDQSTTQPLKSVRLSSSGGVAALVHESGEVKILKSDDGTLLATFPESRGAATESSEESVTPRTRKVLASALSPNGDVVGLVNDAGVVEFLNWRKSARTASAIKKSNSGGQDTQAADASVTIKSSNVGSRILHSLDVAFSPDSSQFLVGGGDGLLQIVDVKTSRILSTREVAGPTDGAVTVAFANGGKTAVFGDCYGRLAFHWPDRPDVGGASTFSMQFDTLSAIHSIVASPDGNFITVIAGWPAGVKTFAHRLDVSDKHPKVVFSRPISHAPGDILGVCALDESAKSVQLLLRSAKDTIEFKPVRFDLEKTQPVSGNPFDLLAAWERKLLLPFSVSLGLSQQAEANFNSDVLLTTEQEVENAPATPPEATLDVTVP